MRTVSQTNARPSWSITKRQLLVAGVIFAILALVISIIYLQDRNREWRLRSQQAAHRLELAYELVVRDFQRVRSDLMFVANQPSIKSFDAEEPESRRRCEQVFSDFLQTKPTYQQIRLIDAHGIEAVRADVVNREVQVVQKDRLQDKKDRYYVQKSMKLKMGDLFVSEFDLNLEHGIIEKPLNPVIRFVTPVANSKAGLLPGLRHDYLLVVNYKGAPLLNDLSLISLPGYTYLVREDGHFLLGSTPDDGWGWLLDHDRTFPSRFPVAWLSRSSEVECRLTDQGAFAFRQLGSPGGDNLQKGLFIVSHLPAKVVFDTSKKLLLKLGLVLAAAALPILLLTRYWAGATHRRQMQAELIRDSEKKLRQLSTRLVKIQEEERRAISREIHDQLGQQATAINLDLKLAMRETKDPAAREHLLRTIKETEQLLDGLHDFATRVRPIELDDLGLKDAVESQVWAFNERYGIAITLDTDFADHNLAREVSENVFRLIQESLNNVLKHANASAVKLNISSEPRGSSRAEDYLLITIHDDGMGLEHSQKSQERTDDRRARLGILGMQERVELLKGTMDIKSKPGEGTTVTAKIPL